ncbi:MAG: glycine--tRNA ligase [Candidatus Micrarchaeota archaeon]|nr:glycine--tRNA ligase [Candidatus Micrarchaeota archaeon]
MASKYENILNFCFKKGYFYPSNEIYESVAGFYDYGPIGAKIKKKIVDIWRNIFIDRTGFHEVESTIVGPEIMYKASGHVDEFTDPAAECLKCHSIIRIDKLIEEKLGIVWDGKMETIESIHNQHKLKCPICGGEIGNFKKVNLMFKTGIGYGNTLGYLRPETAQGIYTSTIRNAKTLGLKLPFGIGQLGKVFRNEISPRQGLLRLREFSQLELEYFVDPNNFNCNIYDRYKDMEIPFMAQDGETMRKVKISKLFEEGILNKPFGSLLGMDMEIMTRIGINLSKVRFRHLRDDEKAHYSKISVDVEIETEAGMLEVISNAHRTDYDLGRHQKFSGKNLTMQTEKGNVIPNCVESSIGLDRLFYCAIDHGYRGEGRENEWMQISKSISPFNVAVFPLERRDGLDIKAKEVMEMLVNKGISVFYSDTGSIGRRYARADEIGIPLTVTVDYDILDGNAVTIRDRDTMKQEKAFLEDIEKMVR